MSLRSAAYLVEHPSVTDVRMCVAGGRCRRCTCWPYRPPRSGRSRRRRRAAPQHLEFDHVLPTRVTRRGSDGLPVRLTVTMYAGRIPVHTSQATLGPLTVNPGGGCHVTGYWVFAELRADGSLGHGQVA